MRGTFSPTLAGNLSFFSISESAKVTPPDTSRPRSRTFSAVQATSRPSVRILSMFWMLVTLGNTVTSVCE